MKAVSLPAEPQGKSAHAHGTWKKRQILLPNKLSGPHWVPHCPLHSQGQVLLPSTSRRPQCGPVPRSSVQGQPHWPRHPRPTAMYSRPSYDWTRVRPDLRHTHPEAPPEVKAGSRDRHGRKFSSIRGQRPALPCQDQRVPLCVCVCVCVWWRGWGARD